MIKIIKPLLLLLLSISFVSGFNHPEIEWKSVSTDHFIINYYDKTEPAVHAAAMIAENAYTVLANLYKYRPGYLLNQKIALSLAEYDDYANGFASWLDGSIMIWLPDSRWDLRGNTTWLNNVITHELAHIISLHQKRSLQLLDISLSFELSTPDETYGFKEPFARTTLFPMWLVEGIAQYETARQEGDCYDARRGAA